MKSEKNRSRNNGEIFFFQKKIQKSQHPKTKPCKSNISTLEEKRTFTVEALILEKKGEEKIGERRLIAGRSIGGKTSCSKKD